MFCPVSLSLSVMSLVSCFLFPFFPLSFELVFCFANVYPPRVKFYCAICRPLSCFLIIVVRSFKRPVYHIDFSFLKLCIFQSISFSSFLDNGLLKRRDFLVTRTLRTTQVYAQDGKCHVKTSSSCICLLTQFRENSQKDVLIVFPCYSTVCYCPV